ncbi:septum site-determining protein MinC [Leptolyngbya sp. PCC 6406]|uniref:septum site-determining protein MinC n=1 Tax=Leptolyngbya sp. PCC 6406 TaxID=1173264 RepID=UPI0002ABCBD8|nr:septum site-determining protein MinC [Leptolyngbya sp. PCC 6406]
MNSESPSPQAVSELPAPEINPDTQVRFKSQNGRLLLLLPPDPEGELAPLPWTDLWEQLQQRLVSGDRFWQPRTTVHLLTRDRLLDARQLQAIEDTLAKVDLLLKRVYTSRRQTAVAAATAGYSVEQHAPVAHLKQSPIEPGRPLEDPLYTQGTIRSGGEVRHRGTVVVLGDVNPGGSVVADGDILVWGRLRGLAHAGAQGNAQCRIMALRMEPTQLRIADKVARPPETPPAEYWPEVAYIGNGAIRIALAQEFSRLGIKTYSASPTGIPSGQP